MKNLTQANKQLNTLISAGYLGLVCVLAVILLPAGAPAVQASSHCPGGYDVCQNDSAAFTLNVVADDAGIGQFIIPNETGLTQTGPQQYDIMLTELSWPFKLSWNTTNAARVESASNPEHRDWENGDTQTKNGSQTIGRSSGSSQADLVNLYYEIPTQKTYEYKLEAFNVENNSTTSQILATVFDPPRFITSFGSQTPPELDGEPGSTSSIPVNIEAHKFDGSFSLSVATERLPANLKRDGNSLVVFTFVPEVVTFNYGAGGYASANNVDLTKTATLNMQVVQPIYDDISPGASIPVTVSNPSGPNQNVSFLLKVDGFSPRTIEEF
jgi:hypothetical protein